MDMMEYNTGALDLNEGDQAQLQCDEFGNLKVTSTGANGTTPASATNPAPVSSSGWGFDVVAAPAVTAGAYSAGDIMGGLITFSNVARVADEAFIITEIQVALKAAVTPALTAVLWSADPTTVADFEDNDAYAVPAADIFKVRGSLPFAALGGYLTDHGTPNTYRLSIPGGLVMKPYAGTRNTKLTLIDGTGVTLASTSDLQVRLVGLGV